MCTILHDIRVAVWAWRTNHPDHADIRFGFIPLIKIRRLRPLHRDEWVVRIRTPRLYIINADTVESDYRATLTRSAD